MIGVLQVPIYIRIEEDGTHCYNPFKDDKTKKFNSCYASDLNCNNGYTTGCNAFGCNLRWDESYQTYV